MPLYNPVITSNKIDKLEEEIAELNKKLDNVLKNQLTDKNGFMEIISNMNNLKIENFKINEELNNLKYKYINRPKIKELSEELTNLVENNGLETYIEELKYIGIRTIDELLLLDIHDLTENGIIYLDGKKLLESAKMSIENRDLLN
jgi:hypothetical protein